jgi:hypothetical protein
MNLLMYPFLKGAADKRLPRAYHKYHDPQSLKNNVLTPPIVTVMRRIGLLNRTACAESFCGFGARHSISRVDDGCGMLGWKDTAEPSIFTYSVSTPSVHYCIAMTAAEGRRTINVIHSDPQYCGVSIRQKLEGRLGWAETISTS